jgi:hypothetical protein
MTPPAAKIFESDTLTAEQRFEAVVRLEAPDRVPLSLMLYHFAPGYAGLPMSRYMTEPACYQRAMQRVWEELGPWDLYYNINPVSRLAYSYVMMMRVLWPGRELAEDEMAKVDEQAYMEAEDYQRVLDLPGWAADLLFRVDMLPRFCQEAAGLSRTPLLAKILANALRHVTLWRREFPWWRRQGAAVQIGYQAEMPFDTLSQARSLIPFSLDLLRNPEQIRRAANHLSPSFADLAILVARLTGVPRVQCYCHRSSNSFISPQQFEALALPSMEIALQRLIDAGLTPILHCDGDWLKNLPAMRRLPAGKIVLQLDGLTDIFQAKEIIGDRTCLFGDVPAAKLATGSPAEVEEYCHRLIEEVGRGGGFILAGGCEIPPNARPENLRAMVRAVRRYGVYGVYATGGAERAAA